VFAAHLDLTDPLSIDRFMQSADYLVGAADVLISSAGIADRSWVGAQHLVAQLVTPMIDNGRGDVVLLSPELIGAAPDGANRMLDAWVSGLDAEFVGTGVRASVVRSTGQVPPDDVGRLIAAFPRRTWRRSAGVHEARSRRRQVHRPRHLRVDRRRRI
jgi:NAD(P)-dependent dehydrogenase (short-subunit alcohol dehydrogenase family)